LSTKTEPASKLGKPALLSILTKVIAIVVGLIIGKYLRDYMKTPDSLGYATWSTPVIKTTPDAQGKMFWMDIGDVTIIVLGIVLAVFGPKIHLLVRYVGIGLAAYNIQRPVTDML